MFIFTIEFYTILIGWMFLVTSKFTFTDARAVLNIESSFWWGSLTLQPIKMWINWKVQLNGMQFYGLAHWIKFRFFLRNGHNHFKDLSSGVDQCSYFLLCITRFLDFIPFSPSPLIIIQTITYLKCVPLIKPKFSVENIMQQEKTNWKQNVVIFT